MRKSLVSLLAGFAVLFLALTANAQPIVVTGSNTLNASYPSFSGAAGLFAALNGGPSQSGFTITVSVSADESAEDGSNLLNAGAWTSITITPSGNRNISGANAGPMLVLNGAGNVTFNGLNSGGNSLSISNTNNGVGANTIKFIGDASNNTITNCTVLGSSTATTIGTIWFSTGTTTGNIGNTVSNCNITLAGVNNPVNAIYSAGTSIAIPNTVTVSGNTISDYFSATLATCGINVSATGNTGWTITNNKLFQTATRIYTTANTHNGILVASGVSYTITGNVIGFANSGGTGTTNMVGNSVALGGTFPSSYTTAGTATATRYIAINCSFTAAGAASSIQNNTIAGFALYTSSGAATTNGVFCGIQVLTGNANIGTTTGNTIGATSGNGSIYTASTTTGGTVVGIYCASVNTISIQNNTFGAIDASGTTATLSGGFTGIDCAGAASIYTISINTIGNSTADNIRIGYFLSGGNLSNAGTATSTTGATGAIVCIRNTGTGTSTIQYNTLRGLMIGSTVGAFTGIIASGATATSNTIFLNALGTSGLGLVRYPFACSGAFIGVSASGTAAAAPLRITYNDIQGVVNTTNGTSAHTYITFNHGASVMDSVSFNTFTNLNIATSGADILINRGTTSMTASGFLVVYNNSIVTAYNKSVAGAFTGFTNGGGASSVLGSKIWSRFNNFSNITLTGISAAILWSDADGPGAGNGPAKSITNNTFNAVTVGGVAQITGISWSFSGGDSISNNTLTNLTSNGIILAISQGTSVWGTETIYNNTLTNFTSLAQINTLQLGAATAAGVTTNISNNTIRTIYTSSLANSVFGIICTGGVASQVTNIYKNTVGDLKSDFAGASLVTGILGQTLGTYNIYNNLVGDLKVPQSTSTNAATGISIGAAVTANVYYNSVYLNSTSTSVTTFGTTCLLYSSTATTMTSRNNVLYNSSTPAQEGSNSDVNGVVACLRRTTGTAAVVPANYNTASNTNVYWVNPTAGTNNHLTYAEGTAAYTNSQNTVALMKTFFVNRDQQSQKENIAFQSTTPSNANFLKFPTGSASACESGGVGIGSAPFPAPYNDDYAGTIRQGSTGYAGTGSAPDIGAWELEGIALDQSAPIISYSALGNTSSLSNRALSATLTDQTGVDNTVTFRPRIYYRKNAGAYFSTQGSLTAGSVTNGTWSFTIDNSLIGGVAATDVIGYYVIAQDVVGPYISSNPAGVVATDVNTVGTPPAPRTYTIVGVPLSGDFIVGDGFFTRVTGLHLDWSVRTRKVMREVPVEADKSMVGQKDNQPVEPEHLVGAPYATGKSRMIEVDEQYSVPMLNGQEYKGSLYHEFTKEEKSRLNLMNPDMTPGVYATITAAVADVNARGIGATDCRLVLDDVAYNTGTGETYPIIIDATTQLPTATSQLIIKPNSAATNTVSGSSTTGIFVSRCPYVVIDGTAIGNSGTRDMTVQNTNTTSGAYVVGLFNNTSPNKADNNTVKNCNIIGGMVAAAVTPLFGIIFNASGGDYDNSLIDNNSITSVRVAIQVAGIIGGTTDNCTISNNTIGSATDALSCFFQGITVSQADNTIISGNDISGEVTGNTINGGTANPTTNFSCIFISTGSTNTKVRKNKIHDEYYNGSGGYGASGIVYSVASNNTGTTEISNNLIYNIKGDGDAVTTAAASMGYIPLGICIYANGTSAIQVYYNSVYMSGATLTATFNGHSDCLGVSSGVGTGSMNVRNNLFRNSMTGAGTGPANIIWVAGGAIGTIFSALDYNNLYTDGQNPTIGNINGSGSATIALWRTASGKEASSISGTIPFTGTSDLTIDNTVAAAWNVHGGGTPIATFSTDYTGATRSTTVAGGSTDLGAYNVAPSTAPPIATMTGTIASGNTTTFTVSGKLIASILWNAGGTLPTQLDAQYYPGTYPDSSSLRTRSNCFWKFTATGGTGYNYDITLNYDLTELSVISAENNINIAKSEFGGNWFRWITTTVNTVNHTATVQGIPNGFSQFTLTDSSANNAPLPVELASFTSNIDHRNVELKWSTAAEQNNAGFDVERKISGTSTWNKVGNVAGHGTSSVTNNYSFRERNLPTASYNYRLKQIDNNGNFKYYDLTNEVIIGVPTAFSISQNYPNPFNPTTKINYDLPFDSKVSIVLFDMTGRQVAELLNTNVTAGYQTVSFNASNLSSGTYFYQINANGGNQSFSKTLKMMLVK
ncbi:hypothetical protein BH10BAC5_BH10BAC5_07440 [soil metagenome]